VDNFVGKYRRIVPRARRHAGFSQLPKRKAQKICFIFKGLKKDFHETNLSGRKIVVAVHNFIL
jgi:hypothetical protein